MEHFDDPPDDSESWQDSNALKRKRQEEEEEAPEDGTPVPNEEQQPRKRIRRRSHRGALGKKRSLETAFAEVEREQEQSVSMEPCNKMARMVNIVTPHLDTAMTQVWFDPAGNNDPVAAAVYLTESRPQPAFNGGGTLHRHEPHTEVFFNQDCTDPVEFDNDGNARFDLAQLTRTPPLPLYIRSTTAGPASLSLALDNPGVPDCLVQEPSHQTLDIREVNVVTPRLDVPAGTRWFRPTHTAEGSIRIRACLTQTRPSVGYGGDGTLKRTGGISVYSDPECLNPIVFGNDGVPVSNAELKDEQGPPLYVKNSVEAHGQLTLELDPSDSVRTRVITQVSAPLDIKVAKTVTPHIDLLEGADVWFDVDGGPAGTTQIQVYLTQDHPEIVYDGGGTLERSRTSVEVYWNEECDQPVVFDNEGRASLSNADLTRDPRRVLYVKGMSLDQVDLTLSLDDPHDESIVVGPSASQSLSVKAMSTVVPLIEVQKQDVYVHDPDGDLFDPLWVKVDLRQENFAGTHYTGTVKLHCNAPHLQLHGQDQSQRHITFDGDGNATLEREDLGKELYVKGIAPGALTFQASLEAANHKSLKTTATANAQVEAKQAVVLIPKIEAEYKIVLLDKNLSQHQDGSEQKLQTDPVYIELSYEPKHPSYNKEATLTCNQPLLHFYRNEACTDPFDPATTKLTTEELTKQPKFRLYLRGKTAGTVDLELKLDPPDTRATVAGKEATVKLGVVQLDMELYTHNPASPFTQDVKLSDEAKVKTGRLLHVQPSGKKDHARAKLVVKKLEATHWPDGCDDYKIVLNAKNQHGETELYDAETDGSLHAYPVEITKGTLASGDVTYWLQGKTSTNAHRDIVLDVGIDRPVGGLPKTEKRRADWARLTVVEIDEVKPSSEFAASTTDYDNDKFKAFINEADDPDGRKIKLKAKLKERLKDVKIHFLLAPHKDNGKVANNKVDFPGALPDDLKHVDREPNGSKPHLSALTDVDGCAEVELTLPRAGGDVFFAGAYISDEPYFTQYVHDDATHGVKKPALSKKLTVWRKLYYQLSHRNTLVIPARGDFHNAMREVFIEPVEHVHDYDPTTIGGLTTHKRWMIQSETDGTLTANDDIVVVGDHNKHRFRGLFTAHVSKRPRCHVIVIDAQWDPMDESSTHVASYDFDGLSKTVTGKNDGGQKLGIFKPTLNGNNVVKSGEWSWDGHEGPIDDSMITIPPGRSKESKYTITLPAVCPASCPCGAPGTAIAPDASDPASVDIEIRGADGPFSGESGSAATPHILAEVDNSNAFNDTLAHELGHMFSQVNTAREGTTWAPHPNKYEDRGGQGSHCKQDAIEDPTEQDDNGDNVYTDGTCIMFHEGSSTHSMRFCENCALNLLVRDNSRFS